MPDALTFHRAAHRLHILRHPIAAGVMARPVERRFAIVDGAAVG